jgi:tetratricopeptide (TPR) repeat protein
MNNLGALLYQVGLKEEAERMFKKGLNLKIYHQELNYNFLNCHLLKEEYMMAENLIQRFEAFMGKSPLLYEKHAILNYKMNRLTLALFDIESALSLDKNHSDALYLKSLIFLREEDFQGAINAVLEATKISPRYTGLAFFLALGERQRMTPARIDAQMPAEPEDDLIELLQLGIGRRFDKIKELLVSVVERGLKKIGEKGSAANANSEDTPGPAAAARKQAPAGADRKAEPAARQVDTKGADAASGAGEDSVHALIEALSDISLEEDDQL